MLGRETKQNNRHIMTALQGEANFHDCRVHIAIEISDIKPNETASD